MKIRKFKSNKLWRDKIVDEVAYDGSKVHWIQLDDNEFAQQLKRKFVEEAQEVANAQTREALIEELADILEVISSLGDVHTFTLDDVITVQRKKYVERGGFSGRKFVTITEHAVGSVGEKYCLADPEKYPELVE